MYRNLFRDRKDYTARVLLLPLFFVFILIFLGRLKHNQKSIQDRVGLLYQSSTVPPFMGIINSVALCMYLCSSRFVVRPNFVPMNITSYTSFSSFFFSVVNITFDYCNLIICSWFSSPQLLYINPTERCQWQRTTHGCNRTFTRKSWFLDVLCCVLTTFKTFMYLTDIDSWRLCLYSHHLVNIISCSVIAKLIKSNVYQCS